jgi:iron complex transport system permease protein
MSAPVSLHPIVTDQRETRMPSTPIRGLAIVVAVLAATVVASVLIGSRPVPLSAVLDPTHPLHAISAARIARTALGLAVGAALGVTGACLQGVTRNPLGDPGILGINAGASFAMVLAMAGMGVSTITGFVWFGFAGAAVAMGVVHGIAGLGPGGATPANITIAGAALTAALLSLTTAVLLTNRATMESFRYWQVGTIGGRDLGILASMLPILVVGFALAVTGARVLDALALGDDLAVGLGERLVLGRLVVSAAVILLAGAATALAGPIAFVGLVVVHTVRALVGPPYLRVIPVSALAGAAVVVAADTVGRVVLPPAEVQVGIMAALVGLPAFLVLLRRSRWGMAT